MPSFCDTCCKRGATNRCSRCKEAYYCDVKCQRKHWAIHKKKCYIFKLGEEVKWKLPIKNTFRYATATITGLLPNRQYRVRIDRFSLRLNPSLTKLIYVANENEIKKETKERKQIDLMGSKNSNILDLYLEGRDCKKHMKSLSDSITKTHKMSVISSQFISIKILEFLFKPKYKWRISCFFCNNLNILMERNSARYHAINSYKAHTLFNTIDDYSITVFCDECNEFIDYDDITFECSNKVHDICLKCVYQKKIIPYLRLKDCIIPLLINILDHDCAQEIFEYVVGRLRQFV